MTAKILPLKGIKPASTSDELSQQLRALADSLDGLNEIGQLKMTSAIIVIECENGELIPTVIGQDDWARAVGILFAAAQQVVRGE